VQNQSLLFLLVLGLLSRQLIKGSPDARTSTVHRTSSIRNEKRRFFRCYAKSIRTRKLWDSDERRGILGAYLWPERRRGRGERIRREWSPWLLRSTVPLGLLAPSVFGTSARTAGAWISWAASWAFLPVVLRGARSSSHF
jgi:hypothetical protein